MQQRCMLLDLQDPGFCPCIGPLWQYGGGGELFPVGIIDPQGNPAADAVSRAGGRKVSALLQVCSREVKGLGDS